MKQNANIIPNINSHGKLIVSLDSDGNPIRPQMAYPYFKGCTVQVDGDTVVDKTTYKGDNANVKEFFDRDESDPLYGYLILEDDKENLLKTIECFKKFDEKAPDLTGLESWVYYSLSSIITTASQSGWGNFDVGVHTVDMLNMNGLFKTSSFIVSDKARDVLIIEFEDIIYKQGDDLVVASIQLNDNRTSFISSADNVEQDSIEAMHTNSHTEQIFKGLPIDGTYLVTRSIQVHQGEVTKFNFHFFKGEHNE